MKNFKIKTIFANPEVPKAHTIKTGISFMIFILIFIEKIVCNSMQYMIFQSGWELVLSQRIVIGFEAILEKYQTRPPQVDPS